MSSTLDKNKQKIAYFSDNCIIDESLKYSGLYTDLCGMSMEDYIKAGKCCCDKEDNDNPGGGDVPSKTTNVLTITINNGFLAVKASYNPMVDITLSCVCEGTTVTFVINSNNWVMSDMKPTSGNLNISDITVTPDEDEKYKYVTKTESISEGIMILTPNKVVKYNEINLINADDLTSEDIINDNKVLQLNYAAPVNEETNIINMGEIPSGYESTVEWYEKNSWLPIFAIQKDMLDKIKITNIMGYDITNEFETIRTLTIDGKEWCIVAQLYYGEVEESEFPDYLPFNGKQVIILPPDASANDDTEITLNFELK